MTCAFWQINDVRTTRIQGTWEVRLDDANYPVARYPQHPNGPFGSFWYDYRCELMTLGETVGWDPDEQWVVVPRKKFTQGFHIRSDNPIYSNPRCNPNSVHMVSEVPVRGPSK